ncbi:MAG: histidine ammonia-lyase, partial [Bdellovibrionota bacterium]
MVILENTLNVVAIEMLSSCQAIELRRPLKTSAALEKVWVRVREDVAFLDHDRILHNDITSLAELISSGDLLAFKPSSKE